MAKVRGPLLSLSASGQIAKSAVFSSWRGVAYARQHVDPANPKTAEQTAVRDVFAMLDELYKRMGPLSRAVWDAEVQRRPLTARNALIRANVPALRGDVDMADWIGSMGALAGLPPTSIAAVGGAAAGEIDVTVGAPQEPTGWTLDAVVVHAIHDQDPTLAPTEFVTEAEDAGAMPNSDTTITLSGLNSAESYVTAGWLRWTRPDGRLAYGASLTSAIVAAT